MTTITNNVPRPIINDYELTAKERAEFDYLDWDAIERGEDSASFFRYKGQLYDLSDFIAINTGPFTHVPADSELAKWAAYANDSFFSAVVIRWPIEDGEPNFESVIVGMVMS